MALPSPFFFGATIPYITSLYQWSSLYSTIISSDSTLTFALPQKQVQAVTHSFSKATDQNNAAVDSLKLNPLRTPGGDAPLRQVDFSKNGVKLGFDHSLDVAARASDGLPETQVLTQSIGALQPYRSATHIGNTPIGVGFCVEQKPRHACGAFLCSTEDANRRAPGIGLNLDKISGVGQQFSGQPYSARIRSDLQGDQSNAAHTHVLASAAIQYGPQGVVVSG